MRQALFVLAIAVILTTAVTALASAACNTCALGMGMCGYNASGCRPAQSCDTCAPACPPVATTCAPACPPVVTQTVAPACPPVVTQTVAPACPPETTACAPTPQVMGYCAQPTNACGPMPVQRWQANLASVGASACGACGGGDATFQLTKECDKLRYWVNVQEMTDVTRAEIRLVTNGCDLANAPVVATLFNGKGGYGCTSGRLTRGNISAYDLQGPFQGQPLDSLLTALTNGTAVVAVATCANPCGEIAGLAGCEASHAPC